MLITLEASDIATILQEAIRQQYRTPNVSITDKSLKKMRNIKVELQVVPSSPRTPNMQDIEGDARMRDLANRMRVQEEPDTITPEFGDSGL